MADVAVDESLKVIMKEALEEVVITTKPEKIFVPVKPYDSETGIRKS